MATNGDRPVSIDERLVSRIGVREWGLPTLVVPGQIWQSERRGTVSCMVRSDEFGKVRIETRPLVVLPVGELSWLPDHWRSALWEYVQSWPQSGCGLGPLLAISREQRHALLRRLASDLLATDEIGSVVIANSLGLLAAVEFERPEVCGEGR